MDEPTTHLDMSSIDALIRALEPYEGTLIFISHDVYFIRKLARQVLHVDGGRLTMYHGDYGYYLDKLAVQAASAAGAPKPARPPEEKSKKRLEAEARQARSRERRALEKVVDKLEADIATLETKQKELATELENPATYDQPGRAVAVNRELQYVIEDLERATKDWEAAASKLEQLQ